MSDSIPMTREGYNKIRQEVERLEQEEMPKIVARIAEARAEGDLKENAEYHGARESQGILQAQINEMKGKLARATILDPTAGPQNEIRFGATIKVKRLSNGRKEEFSLVGAGDEDFGEGKILATSPLGSGFLGHKVGDTVKIEVPAGILEFEILSISYQ
ncbi:MAG: transcription elongation factor GreA [Planctomycetaceae bacterium]|nr:transcription elongation factor GreA [Planctomycetaceae bacterium]